MHFFTFPSSTFVASLALYLVVFLHLPFSAHAASATATATATATGAASSSSSTAPPACLLGALQLLPDPADIKSICSDDQSAVQGNLSSVCTGDDLSSAYSVFSATCKDGGVTVSSLTASATHTAEATGTATSGAASGTASGTGAGQTGAAGLPSVPQQPLVLLSGLAGFVGMLFL